jgi:hypothetical protein
VGEPRREEAQRHGCKLQCPGSRLPPEAPGFSYTPNLGILPVPTPSHALQTAAA